jgi:hypothetical protein
MIETLTLITLCVLYLVIFRSGKTPKSDKPHIIERTGLYRITFAPQLNLAQPFIEAVARLLLQDGLMIESGAEYVFVVHDTHGLPKGNEHYFLTITRHNGLLEFAATELSASHRAASGNADGAIMLEVLQAVAAKYGIAVEVYRA